jgi:hypothetical protein
LRMGSSLGKDRENTVPTRPRRVELSRLSWKHRARCDLLLNWNPDAKKERTRAEMAGSSAQVRVQAVVEPRELIVRQLAQLPAQAALPDLPDARNHGVALLPGKAANRHAQRPDLWGDARCWNDHHRVEHVVVEGSSSSSGRGRRGASAAGGCRDRVVQAGLSRDGSPWQDRSAAHGAPHDNTRRARRRPPSPPLL